MQWKTLITCQIPHLRVIEHQAEKQCFTSLWWVLCLFDLSTHTASLIYVGSEVYWVWFPGGVKLIFKNYFKVICVLEHWATRMLHKTACW